MLAYAVYLIHNFVKIEAFLSYAAHKYANAGGGQNHAEMDLVTVTTAITVPAWNREKVKGTSRGRKRF